MADSEEVINTVAATNCKVDSDTKPDSESNADVDKDSSVAANGNITTNGEAATEELLAPADSYWTTKQDGAVKLRIGTTQFDNQVPTTIPKLFQSVVKKASELTALAAKRNGEWKKWTYKEYYETCRVVAKGFIKLGLEQFKSVCILGFNAPEWFFAHHAAMFAGGLSVGIYATNSPEACQYVADNCSANILVVENNAQLSKILQVWDQLPNLKAIVQFSGELEDKSNPNVYEWDKFMEIGKSCDDEELDKRINALKANRCCSLIYTSGTTGSPKGVMLSHDNVCFTAAVALPLLKCKFGEEHVVSFLPLSHVAAQLLDIYVTLLAAGTVWFAQPDALKGSLGETLKEVRPTVFFGVPRVWEKIKEKLLDAGRSTTGIKRKIATWAKKIGLEGNMNIEKGQPVPFGWGIANALVFKKVKVTLGLDRAKFLATGAAPMTMETYRYFQSIDIPLMAVYGMSECSGPQTAGVPEAYLIGSCGKNVDGFTLKIAEPDEDGNGEVCMKGRHVFMGYLNLEQKTKEIFDEEGFIQSGDIGKLDENGFLFITGRIKELIITAGGENIAPVPIEEKVKAEVPLISNMMLIGDKRKFLSCLLTLKVLMNVDTGESTDQLTDTAIDYCKQQGSDVTTVSEFLEKKDEKLTKAIQDGINRYNAVAMSNAQKIQKWCILEHDFSIPGGELGPTMKMRRPILEKKYAEKIDAFYQ